MRRKKYKVGDRVFYECYDGTIGEDIVTDIKPDSYVNTNGKTINFNQLYFGDNFSGEDYSMLSERDPRVIEYKKTHKDPRKFICKFEAFMKENKFDINSFAFKKYLYGLL